MSLSGLTFTYNGTAYTGSNAAAASVVNTGDISLNSYLLNKTAAISNVTIYNSSGLTVKVSAPKGGAVGGYTNITATITYDGNSTSHVIGRLFWQKESGEPLMSTSIDNNGYNNGYSTFGVTGILGWTSISITSSHTLSVPAVTGSGYSRTITLIA